MSICKYPVIIKNGWWEQAWYDQSNPLGWWNNQCVGRQSDVSVTASLTETPVFQDIMGDNRTVRIYPLVQADIGRLVTIFGVDNNNQVLRTKQSDGTWRDGHVIQIANPFGSSSTFIRRIDRVLIEDGVQSTLRAYAYDSVNNVLEDLAVWEPGETNPAYVRQQIRMGQCGPNGTQCCGSVPILALVKLRFLPARYDTDLVLIENVDALKLMLQAVEFEEQGARANARAYETDAIRECNLDLWDRDQEDQIPVDFAPLMGTNIGVQKCF